MSKEERVKMTLLLTSETITLLKKYSYEQTGSTNVSKAVISMAKEYYDKKEKSESN